MTVQTPGFLSEPKIHSLVALLKMLSTGELEVPRFSQRPYPWDAARQLDLLRSVRDGLPIGSLMIWETRTLIPANDRLGDRILPRSNAPIRKYVIDGQQRLATLYAALVPPGEGDAIPTESVYFDLVFDDFVMLSPREVGAQHLDLRLVLDSVRFRKVQRAFAEEVEDLWIKRSDRVATAFKDYQVVMVTLKTDDIALVVRAFEQANRSSLPLKRVHMVHALSWSETFPLAERLEALRASRLSDIGWAEIDDECILEACRMHLGLSRDDRQSSRFVEAVRLTPGVLEDAADSLSRAARFLHDRCHVRTPRLLPFGQQILVLARAFWGVSADDGGAATRLEAWFWVSSLLGWFEGGRGAVVQERLQSALDTIVAIARGEHRQPFGTSAEHKPLGQTLNLDTSRGRVFVLLLATLRPRLADGQAVNLEPLLDYGQSKLVGLFPYDRLREAVRSPGNQFLVARNDAAALRQRLMEPSLGEDVRLIAESHAVTESARELLRRDDAEGFVKARLAALDALEENLLQNYLSVLE